VDDDDDPRDIDFFDYWSLFPKGTTSKGGWMMMMSMLGSRNRQPSPNNNGNARPKSNLSERRGCAPKKQETQSIWAMMIDSGGQLFLFLSILVLLVAFLLFLCRRRLGNGQYNQSLKIEK
jgi:hypothetical protein